MTDNGVSREDMRTALGPSDDEAPIKDEAPIMDVGPATISDTSPDLAPRGLRMSRVVAHRIAPWCGCILPMCRVGRGKTRRPPHSVM